MIVLGFLVHTTPAVYNLGPPTKYTQESPMVLNFAHCDLLSKAGINICYDRFSGNAIIHNTNDVPIKIIKIRAHGKKNVLLDWEKILKPLEHVDDDPCDDENEFYIFQGKTLETVIRLKPVSPNKTFDDFI